MGDAASKRGRDHVLNSKFVWLRLTEAFMSCEWLIHIRLLAGGTLNGWRPKVSRVVCNRIQLDTIMTVDVQLTPEFNAWLSQLKDGATRARITARLRQAGMGHLGDWKSLGGGLAEMRLHWGPGWRLYFTRVNGILMVMLAGGDKSTQPDDIRRAQRLLRDLLDERLEP
jgi:putative addiction module killer protein